MTGHTIRLIGPSQRNLAHDTINRAPDRAIVTIKPETRNDDQNALMWVLLSDVSRAKPEGRKWVPETWKAAFMQSLGHQCQFAEGLDNSGPFPIGFKSSRLSVKQMADLITVIQEYGDRHGIAWSEPKARVSA
jgi:hypothetical protein